MLMKNVTIEKLKEWINSDDVYDITLSVGVPPVLTREPVKEMEKLKGYNNLTEEDIRTVIKFFEEYFGFTYTETVSIYQKSMINERLVILNQKGEFSVMYRKYKEVHKHDLFINMK